MKSLNLKKRITTAALLIPAVWGCAVLPGSWLIVNIGIFTSVASFIFKSLGFPFMVILEYSNMMKNILDFLSESNEKEF
jgi:hypothetical protein